MWFRKSSWSKVVAGVCIWEKVEGVRRESIIFHTFSSEEGVVNVERLGLTIIKRNVVNTLIKVVTKKKKK